MYDKVTDLYRTEKEYIIDNKLSRKSGIMRYRTQLPPEVRKRFIGFCHSVGIVPLLDRVPLAV